MYVLGRAPRVMVKYIHAYFPSPKKRKEKKGNRGHHNVPETGGQVGKWVDMSYDIFGEARKRVRQFSRDSACPVMGNTHIVTP